MLKKLKSKWSVHFCQVNEHFIQWFQDKKIKKKKLLKQIFTLAALISSSAKHSAIVLMLRKAASLAPVHNNQIAWFTLLKGETSTACRLTVPALPIRVESSRGPELIMAETNVWKTDNFTMIILFVFKQKYKILDLFQIKF